MDETILPPSPNWFQVSGMAVSEDGWIVYGGPSKSLCILEPLPADHKGVLVEPKYHAHVFNRANAEKIVSVDISPEWPAKRTLLTGSSDGSVKHWCVEKLIETNKVKPLLSHEIHSQQKEEVAGVSYSNEVYAVTVGCYGNIVKWDLNSNIVKSYSFVKNFKPICMACSPHLPLNVAIGTKQGVVFVLDLHGNGKILYKVRGQDDEIVNISWCPQFDVSLKRALKESDKRIVAALKDKTHENEDVKQSLDESGLGKKLPEDSFDGNTSEMVEVLEDDMFDIYKDHEADEFGHKKYQPEEISVKVKEDDKKEDDFLAECLKVKAEILKRKTLAEDSIQSLVEAFDNTHVDSQEDEGASSSCVVPSEVKAESCDKSVESSAHIHKHLLATIGKHGGVRIWSKSGKLVGSCVVPSNIMNKNQKAKIPHWPTLLWYKPDVLLIADCKSQLLECNPLKIDCKNKLDWSVVHSLHKRGVYSIKTNAPRVQNGSESNDNWTVYTVSQDRNIIHYSYEKKEKISVLSTSGGFIYTVLPCPYDAGKIAVSVGDGAVRVWETSPLEDDETKLDAGQVTSYWQNVQGKVLVIAWHPTKENLLAFATAESRIGLLDVSGKSEKPARVLLSALTGPIYSICWGEGHDLYACASGDLVVYNASRPEEAPTPVPVEVEGRPWAVSAVSRRARALAAGGGAGGVAALAPSAPHQVMAAAHVFGKMIHMVQWHPQQTSNSSEESPYKDLLAVCSSERHGNIVILEYIEKEDGSKQLQTFKTLSGHKLTVLQVAWNPHQEGQLLSTSQDYTVRIWDVVSGACLSIFGGHSASSLGAAWLAYPQLGGTVVSGGSDCSLRIWDSALYPPDAYKDGKPDTAAKKEKKKSKKEKLKKEEEKEKQAENSSEPSDSIAVNTLALPKGPKKFLLPILYRPNDREFLVQSARIIFKEYLERTSLDNDMKEKISSLIELKQKTFSPKEQSAGAEDAEASSDSSQEGEPPSVEIKSYNFDNLKIFGNINDINQILDKQMELHQASNNVECWIALAIFRGHIDAMIQFAAQRDLLCPYLLSITPCVSYKYWKDVTQMYLAQIDRLVAKGDEKKLEDGRSFGGAVYRKVSLLLSAHDARAAVRALAHARLYAEAYILCRIRYMDSIAEEILTEWAEDRMRCGLFIDAAICYMVLGNLPEAAKLLGKVNDQNCLDLAGDIAKVSGHNMLAEHISEKRENIKNNVQTVDNTEEVLEQLPSRIQLLMKEGNKLNGESNHPIEST